MPNLTEETVIPKFFFAETTRDKQLHLRKNALPENISGKAFLYAAYLVMLF